MSVKSRLRRDDLNQLVTNGKISGMLVDTAGSIFNFVIQEGMRPGRSL